MKGISVNLGDEEAVFYWKDGQVYTEGYDLESEKAVLALTSFGEGIGVLLVASNACCRSEDEFISEVKKFVVGHKRILSKRDVKWPKGQLLFEYFSYCPDASLRWRDLEDVPLSARHYERLWKDPEPTRLAQMTRLKELPEKYFYPLLKLSLPNINYYLARHEKCPIDVLDVLAKNKDVDVRQNVAMNPATPEGILERLAKDRVARIREYVAYNVKCSPRLFDILAHDKNENVRAQVASRRVCPQDILEMLTQDINAMVRLTISNNPICPPRILGLLVQDEDKEVKFYAQRNLAKSQGLEV